MTNRSSLGRAWRAAAAAGRRRGQRLLPRDSLATAKKKKSAGGRLWTSRPPTTRPRRHLSGGFRCDPRGSSSESCFKVLPKSTWIQRRRCCLLGWRSCSSVRGLSWGRPKASSRQVSGWGWGGGVRSPDKCPGSGAHEGWSRPLARAGGKDLRVG